MSNYSQAVSVTGLQLLREGKYARWIPLSCQLFAWGIFYTVRSLAGGSTKSQKVKVAKAEELAGLGTREEAAEEKQTQKSV